MQRILLAMVMLTLVFSGASWAGPRTSATFVRTVDGDTIKVRIGKFDERVRMIGIDTPEKEFNDKARRDMKKTHQDLGTILGQGKTCWDHLNSLLKPGQAIFLEFDASHSDRHGRLLAYVYKADGKMLNEQMLYDGYASPMTVPPNVRYSARLLEAFSQAHSHRRGLWSH